MQDTPEEQYYEIEDVKNQKKYQVKRHSFSYDSINKKLDILNFDPNQFNRVYYNEIAPLLLSEQSVSSSELVSHRNTKEMFYFWAIGSTFFVTILFIVSFTRDIKILPFAIFFLCTHILFVPFILLLSLRKTDRYVFKEKFFSFFDVNYSRYAYLGEDADKRRLIISKWPSKDFSLLREKMVINFNFQYDEGLSIPFKSKTLELLELNAFIGLKSRLLVHYFINKQFKGETIVKPIKEAAKSAFASKQEVYLEDSVFNKNFKIFADDQVEARYLLTTAFTERLLDFQMTHNCTISVLFSNNISKQSNIFLWVDFGKDFFELPKGTGWIHDSSHFYKICREIREIAEIVDALKLDQDIGM